MTSKKTENPQTTNDWRINGQIDQLLKFIYRSHSDVKYKKAGRFIFLVIMAMFYKESNYLCYISIHEATYDFIRYVYLPIPVSVNISTKCNGRKEFRLANKTTIKYI